MRSGREELKALQPPRDHQIPKAGFRLLQGEAQATTRTSEPGRRNRCTDPDIGRRQELVNVVLGTQRGWRQRTELKRSVYRIGMDTVQGAGPGDRGGGG